MRAKKHSDLDLGGLEEDQAGPQGVREVESDDDSHDDDTVSRADWTRDSDTSAASNEPDDAPCPGAAADSTVSADSTDAAAVSVPPGAVGSVGAACVRDSYGPCTRRKADC